MSTVIPGEDSSLSDRLNYALSKMSERAGERISQREIERRLRARFPEKKGWRSDAFLNRYFTSKRGLTAIDPKTAKAIADEMGVEYEWLATGSGPVSRVKSPRRRSSGSMQKVTPPDSSVSRRRSS